MRVYELTVGDWVMYRNREWQVCSLYQFTGEVGLWRNDSQICENVADITPIPLTPEILEKNGLMRVSEEDGYEAYCCNDFLIRRSKFSCTDWWQVDVHYKQYVAHLSGYIQYVHQLQRLLTINECDKKIKL